MALAVLAAFAASCAPRGERSSADGGGALPAATASAPAADAAAATASGAVLAELLVAAGLGVPKAPIAADDFRLASLAGANVRLSDYRGRVVFLNFWATWCPPCRSEMPSMERLHRRLRGRGLEIVAVDLQEDAAAVKSFVKDSSLTFTVLLDADGAVGGAWGAQSIPTTYLIDRGGNIIARAIGSREWDSDAMVTLFETILSAE